MFGWVCVRARRSFKGLQSGLIYPHKATGLTHFLCNFDTGLTQTGLYSKWERGRRWLGLWSCCHLKTIPQVVAPWAATRWIQCSRWPDHTRLNQNIFWCVFVSWNKTKRKRPRWWLRGKESACQCSRQGFDPWSRKIPHAVQQLSPWTVTIEPGL